MLRRACVCGRTASCWCITTLLLECHSACLFREYSWIWHLVWLCDACTFNDASKKPFLRKIGGSDGENILLAFHCAQPTTKPPSGHNRLELRINLLMQLNLIPPTRLKYLLIFVNKLNLFSLLLLLDFNIINVLPLKQYLSA